MAELKTKETNASVQEFLETINPAQMEDANTILHMMEEVTGEKPKMWGTSIIGFGHVHLKYESGRELDWFKIGFSPRKANLTLYGIKFWKQENYLKDLGKFKEGGGCIYIKKLSDINLDELKRLMKEALTRSHRGE